MLRDYNKFPEDYYDADPVKKLALKIEYNSFYYPSANSSNFFAVDYKVIYENITHIGQIINNTLVKHFLNE